jgi:hypothetical protein
MPATPDIARSRRPVSTGGRRRSCDVFRVRESGQSRRPADVGGVCRLRWADGEPVVTVVVRCDPVDCGPGVAPKWPQRS